MELFKPQFKSSLRLQQIRCHMGAAGITEVKRTGDILLAGGSDRFEVGGSNLLSEEGVRQFVYLFIVQSIPPD